MCSCYTGNKVIRSSLYTKNKTTVRNKSPGMEEQMTLSFFLTSVPFNPIKSWENMKPPHFGEDLNPDDLTCIKIRFNMTVDVGSRISQREMSLDATGEEANTHTNGATQAMAKHPTVARPNNSGAALSACLVFPRFGCRCSHVRTTLARYGRNSVGVLSTGALFSGGRSAHSTVCGVRYVRSCRLCTKSTGGFRRAVRLARSQAVQGSNI